MQYVRKYQIIVIIAVILLGIGAGLWAISHKKAQVPPVKDPLQVEVTLTPEEKTKAEQGVVDLQARIQKDCVDNKDTCHDLYLQLGVFKETLGDLRGALDAYEQASKSNSNSYIPYSNAGNIYRRIGQKEKAEEAYRKAISITPNNVNVYTKLYELYRYDFKKYPHEMTVFFSKALKDTGNNLDMIKLYAYYFENVNDPYSALQLWEAMSKNNPNDETMKQKVIELKAKVDADQKRLEQ